MEIPLIVVFTKFDLLEDEHYSKAQKLAFRKPGNKRTPQATAEAGFKAGVAAEDDFKARVESVYSQKKLRCVRIATRFSPSSDSPHVRRLGMLCELTDITRQSLRGVEAELWVPWAAAQQISARQKVEESIKYALAQR